MRAPTGALLAIRRAPRAHLVTDRKTPNPSVTTDIPREVCDALERVCALDCVSKSQYLRRLIVADMKRRGRL